MDGTEMLGGAEPGEANLRRQNMVTLVAAM